MLQSLELQLGIVGPAALGEPVQNGVHSLFGQPIANGWHDQLSNEPGLVLSYTVKWKAALAQSGRWAADLIPELGGSAGNVLLYGELGGILRVGENLGADDGPTRIRPALSGEDYFDDRAVRPGFGGYFFASTQERLIGRNLFLAGNSFVASASVQENWSVLDGSLGVSLFWSRVLRLDLVYTLRQQEFRTQLGPDTFGNINLTFEL